jgi:hypothetical protein
MRSWAPSGVALATLIAAACGSGTAPPVDDFLGTWHATKVEYVSTAGLGTVDLMTLGGAATLQLDADSTATLTITPAGGAPQVTTGTWSRSLDVFNFTVGPASGWSWDYALAGGVLTLTGADTSYDFDHDGTQDDAQFNLTLTK